MALMKWDPSFSVNVREIDLQHQKLIEMLNQLHELMKTGKANEILGPLIDDLINYAATHFATEEKYFAKFSYIGAVAHEGEHRRFVDKVVSFQNEFKKGNTMLTIDVMNFLKDWLINHIKGTDKKYTKCFNDHGLN